MYCQAVKNGDGEKYLLLYHFSQSVLNSTRDSSLVVVVEI